MMQRFESKDIKLECCKTEEPDFWENCFECITNAQASLEGELWKT